MAIFPFMARGRGQELLVVEAGVSAPGDWAFPGYTPTVFPEIDAGRAALTASRWDCVVLSVRGGSPEASAVELLGQACDEAEVALVLAGFGTDPRLAAHLVTAQFDGVVDLDWPPALRCAALDSAIRRFQMGPNVVGLQRVVLDAARVEVRSLEQLVFRDELTGLYNLRYFREVLMKEHARCERHSRPYTLVYLDLDNLKRINTLHGHAAGSAALAGLGAVLKESVRACDYAFRVGGDEFTLLIVESGRHEGLAFAERLMERIRTTAVVFGDILLKITASAGVASFPADGCGSAQVLERSDRAVFQAKEAGRDRVVCYDPSQG